MQPRHHRRHGLAAALLVLSLLALAAGPLASHDGHGCYFEKNCLACRWDADAVADTAAPVALPHPVELVTLVTTEPTASVAYTCLEATFSRGPPLA
jgi:hypothetical protein